MKRFTTKVAVCLLGCYVLSQSAHAINLSNGQALARQCSVCHGKTGVANDPEVPNLAGQSAFYLEKSLKDYRSGARQDRRMTLITEKLKDEEISDIAAWYASFIIEVARPDP